MAPPVWDSGTGVGVTVLLLRSHGQWPRVWRGAELCSQALGFS